MDVVAFRRQLKADMIEWLNLEDIAPDDIADDAPLFGEGEGLGLDSLDAVEIVVMLQRKYGVPQKELAGNREVFATFASLSDFVAARSSR